jgi:hypothetical protein
MPNPSQTWTLTGEHQTEAESAADPAPANPEGDTVDVWAYLAENINEFAVAKSIVDTFGLFLRAKVTIKREQIAFAIEQRATEDAKQAVLKAREESRSARGMLRRAIGFGRSLRLAISANPAPAALAACMVLVMWFR